MTMYIGLDVHSKFCVYVAQNSRGKEIGSGRVATSAQGLARMLESLRAPAGTPVSLGFRVRPFLSVYT